MLQHNVVEKVNAMKRYAIVIEKGATNYGGYVPDLPGCVATGVTVEETERLLREAIELHLAGMREDNLLIPEPSSVVDYLEWDVCA
jgi:predicted RNase H-like HicB family nuclease